MKLNYKYILTFLLCIPLLSFSQDDLLDELEIDETESQYEDAAFKGLKIVNFESTKLVAKGDLTFIVAHRFGSLENGIDTFFGLDDSVTRLNFVYGFTDWLNIGASRSSFDAIYELSLKYRLARQKKEGFPVNIVGYNSITVNTGLDSDNLPGLEFDNRLGYVSQLLISRKFNKNLSLQVAPTFIHEGLVREVNQDNAQYLVGFGGRYKFTKRWSFNADYGLHLNRADGSEARNALSIGFDLETGGHVFQLTFTNARPINAIGFLNQANGNFFEGDIFFGFNLNRTF
ncbi:hypothetical protein D7030_09585 [Flavobacteriaceae bacterium AU392]|nr:hypothetical protein D1817_07230 [Flavobacteriaceae bacterium]RKM83538.1 hypothetical protein D7030_09585 [Flavobacteriaceae bacterium AU392]